ncbi:MAG: glycosyltransferase [Rhodocyclaceae bacterium]|nr:glycosyltransferase [Rhodocyclaceae bacterium]
MHVLHLSDACDAADGVIAPSIDVIRRGLALEGVRSTLVAPGVSSDGGRIGIPARHLPGGGELCWMGWRALTAGTRQLADLGGIDAVHVHSPLLAHRAGTHLATRLGVPLLLSWHQPAEALLPGLMRLLPSGVGHRVARQLTIRRSAAARCVVAASERLGSRLVSYGVRTRIEIVPGGIDPAVYARGDGTAFRIRHGVDPERPLVLVAGAHCADHHATEAESGFLLEVLERAREQAPRAQLIVAGDGADSDAMRYRLRAAGLAARVRVIALAPDSRDLADCYAACDLLALATREDVDGESVLRAMAAGLPVVAIARSGAPDVLRRARGVRLTEDTALALAQAIGRLSSNPRQLAVLSREARSECTHWSQATMAGRLADIYASLFTAPSVSRTAPSYDSNGFATPH